MSSSHESKNFFLDGPQGKLEAIFWRPISHTPPLLASVVCHPHPLFGGTMHNKVVYQAAKSLDALGLPVLRFNFRGAGLSEGKHDKGKGEQGDVQAALDFLATEFSGVPLLLAGFSFGCSVGLRVGCGDSRVKELIGIGAPVGKLDFSYLRQCAKPKLFVHGAQDEHGEIAKVQALVESLPGEKTLVAVADSDHFFTGHLGELDRAITGWMRERHPQLAAAS